MNIDCKQVGKNIKGLRIIYGETQEELAASLKVSKQCVCNFECGRLPRVEYLQAIANHYRIPIEQIIGQRIEISEYELNNELVIDKQYIVDLISASFPLFYSNKAGQETNFCKAFYFSNRIYKSIENEEIIMYTMINLCWKYYRISWKTKKTIEAAANLLSLIFLCFLSNQSEEEIELGKAIMNKKRIDNTVLKKYYLCTSNVKKANEDKEQFIQKHHKEVMELISLLKNTEGWKEVGDFYLALRYIMGLIDNEQDEDTNRLFGYELMGTLIEFDNPYAMDFIAAIYGYYKE